MQWISVKTELPQDLMKVFLHDELCGEEIGHYYSTTKMFIRYVDGFRLENVTHWMLLPPPPNVDSR